MTFTPLINFDFSDLLPIIALIIFIGMVISWIMLGVKAWITRGFEH